MNVNEDSGDQLVRLEWVKSEPIKNWDWQRLERVRQLIFHTTGETYDIDRLRNLPLDEIFGTWTLTESGEDLGILWAMKMDKQTARVLAFSVSIHLQGKGFGALGWSTFAKAAKNGGITQVQLEVRQDNSTAIQMYHRRGLRPQGYLSGFYRGHDGWLMKGPLRVQPSSQ